MARKGWSRADEDRIVGLLRRCTDAQQLKQIHAQLIIHSQSHNTFLLTKLIRTLADLGSLHQARHLFNSVNGPSVFLWTAMIRGYASDSNDASCIEALHLFVEMLRSADRPLTFTLSSVLKACTRLVDLRCGQQLHAHVFKYGFHWEPRVQTTLIQLYSSCDCVEEMKCIFDSMHISDRDVQAWNTVIAGYAKHGDMEVALSLFERMPERNVFTWVEMIAGYANAGKMEAAHALVVDKWLPSSRGDRDDTVVHTALITGYAKCGDILSARLIFDEIIERDVASWNAMISAYSQAGRYIEALHLFRLMIGLNGSCKVEPNRITMATVVSVCSQLGSSDLGQWIEDYIVNHGRDLLNSHTVTALIDMHSKCGDPQRAYKLFQRWKDKDVICYSTMIEGFGVHGHGVEALRIFHQLKEEGLRPDGICFIAVLSACSHAGLVDEGCNYFASMRNQYCIPPTADHYMCMVDLLGRAGRIDEAYRIITKVMPPVRPHAGVWGALLSACRIHCNVVLGEEAAWHLMELEPENAGNYVLLANIYAKARRWEDFAKVRTLMRNYVMRKPPGCSWIEVEGRIYKFLIADVWNIQLEDMLELLGWELKAQGYFPSRDHCERNDHFENFS